MAMARDCGYGQQQSVAACVDRESSPCFVACEMSPHSQYGLLRWDSAPERKSVVTSGYLRLSSFGEHKRGCNRQKHSSVRPAETCQRMMALVQVPVIRALGNRAPCSQYYLIRRRIGKQGSRSTIQRMQNSTCIHQFG